MVRIILKFLWDETFSWILINIDIDGKIDKNCFIWSILAYLYPCEKFHPNRVPKYRKYFNGLNIGGFIFINGFKCSDVHKFEKLKISYINIFELNF